MIETLVQLINRDIEEVTRAMADLAREQRRLAEEKIGWQQTMVQTPDGGLGDPAAIQDWLRFGQRAERALQNLEEKDFLVEERITKCRTQLLALNQRRELLEKVLARRQEAQAAAARRRQERDYTQRGIARRALQEAERELWH